MGLFGGDANLRELKRLREKGSWDELAARAYREITPFSEIVEEIYRQDADALHSRMYGPLRGFVYSVMLQGFNAIKCAEKDKYEKWPNVEELVREEGFAQYVATIIKSSLSEKVSGPIAIGLVRETRERFGTEIAKQRVLIAESEELQYKEKERKRLAESADYKSLDAASFDDFTKQANEKLQKIDEIVDKSFEALKCQLYEAFQKLDSTQFFSACKKLNLNFELTIYGHGNSSLSERLENQRDVDSGVGSELIKAVLRKSEPRYRNGRLFYDETRDLLLLILHKVDDELEMYATSRGQNLAELAATYLARIAQDKMSEFSHQLKADKELRELHVRIFDDASSEKDITQAPYQLEQPRDDKGFRNMYTNITYELHELRGKISEETISRDGAVTELERIRKEFVRMKSQDGQHKDVNRIEDTLRDTENAIKDLL